MTDKQLTQLLIDEIRENRDEIKLMRDELNTLKLTVFSNKTKLSLFIAGVSLLFNAGWAIMLAKIKTLL